MVNPIGKIERVNLREVWPHEALGLTTWLEKNIDVISQVIDIELNNVEREKSIGDFNVDLTAEEKSGNIVVIENQLGKSDHDHLGKIITYLSNIGAKTAIWIVANPRSEHVKAVSWINESNIVNFYLLKIEAIKISGSQPAPLLTLISGPSEEGHRVGETKKELSERHILRKKWWTQLLERAKSKTKLHANISPSESTWVGRGAGRSGLAYNYITTQNYTGTELYIDTGDKVENELIFDKLYKEKNAIETVFGEALQWQKHETKKACIIAKYYEGGGYRDDEGEWQKLHERLINAMILFHKAISPFLKRSP